MGQSRAKHHAVCDYHVRECRKLDHDQRTWLVPRSRPQGEEKRLVVVLTHHCRAHAQKSPFSFVVRGHAESTDTRTSSYERTFVPTSV